MLLSDPPIHVIRYGARQLKKVKPFTANHPSGSARPVFTTGSITTRDPAEITTDQSGSRFLRQAQF